MILEYPEGSGITETRNGTKRYWFAVAGKLIPSYSVWIEVSSDEMIDSSCDCEFGSFWKSHTFNPDQICKHVKECKNYLKEIGVIK